MIHCKVILVISHIDNWLKKGDSRSWEGTEEQTCLLAVPGWQLEGLVSGPRVGHVGRKPRCWNHFLESKVWVKQGFGAAPVPALCTEGTRVSASLSGIQG